VLVQKGGRRLSVPLAPAAVELLASIERDAAARQGPVFRFGNPHIACACPRCTIVVTPASRFTQSSARWRPQIYAAGLDALSEGHLRFHDLRHTFASWALAEGGDLKLVQEAPGHKHITTTARYAHLLTGRREVVVGAVAEKLTGSAGVVTLTKATA
jgi:integrase